MVRTVFSKSILVLGISGRDDVCFLGGKNEEKEEWSKGLKEKNNFLPSSFLFLVVSCS